MSDIKSTEILIELLKSRVGSPVSYADRKDSDRTAPFLADLHLVE